MSFVPHPWRLLHCGTPRLLTRDEFNEIRHSYDPLPQAEHGHSNHEVLYNRDDYDSAPDYRPTCEYVQDLIDEFHQLVSESTTVDAGTEKTERFSALQDGLRSHDVSVQHRPLVVACQGDLLGRRILLEHLMTQGHYKRSLKSPLFTAKTCPTTITFRSTSKTDSFIARLQLRTIRQLELECSEVLFAPLGGYYEDVLPPHCNISGAEVYEPICIDAAQAMFKKLEKDTNFRQGENGGGSYLEFQVRSFDKLNAALERYVGSYEGIIDSIEVEFASPILHFDINIINISNHAPNDTVRARIVNEHLQRADANIICAKLDDCLEDRRLLEPIDQSVASVGLDNTIVVLTSSPNIMADHSIDWILENTHGQTFTRLQNLLYSARPLCSVPRAPWPTLSLPNKLLTILIKLCESKYIRFLEDEIKVAWIRRHALLAYVTLIESYFSFPKNKSLVPHFLEADGYAKPLVEYTSNPLRPPYDKEQHLHTLNRRSLAKIEQRLSRMAIGRWANDAAGHVREHLGVSLGLMEAYCEIPRNVELGFQNGIRRRMSRLRAVLREFREILGGEEFS